MPDQAIAAPLSADERLLFNECEQTIDEGLRTFYAVGTALMQIDDLSLYRETHTSFDRYCQERWGFTGTHGYRQIAAAQTINDIAPLGAGLTHEKTVRPLTSLSDPMEKKLAVQLAFAAAAATVPSRRVTEAIMQQAVDTVLEIKATQGHVDLGSGTMNAAVSSVVVRHHQQVQNAIEEAEEKRNVKTGLVVTVLKRRSVRLISRSGRRVTFEFSDETGLDRLPFTETGIQLEVSLNKKYSGKTTNGSTPSEK